MEGLGPLDTVYAVKCKRCGTFHITDVGLIDAKSAVERGLGHVISGYTREASNLGRPLTLSTEAIVDLCKAPLPVHSVMDRLHRVLEYVGSRIPTLGDYIIINATLDYPVAFVQNQNEMVYIVKTLFNMGLLEGPGSAVFSGQEMAIRCRPTLEGWRILDQLRVSPGPKTDQCFVAMWFDESMWPAFRHGFVPGIERAGYKPLRIDMVEHTGKIDDRIIAEIRRSGLLVADFTGQRGGVYFESGFAMGLGIPVIWTCRDTDVDKLHFDTRQYNHIVWSADNLADLADKLTYRIQAVAPKR